MSQLPALRGESVIHGDDLTTVSFDESAGLHVQIVDLPTQRAGADVPFVSNPPNSGKLTHFRARGGGDAMWSGSCIYYTPGVSPSFSEYDRKDALVRDDGVSERVHAGIWAKRLRQNVVEPTMTRDSRVAAHFDSAPAAQFFQGYWNPHWSGLLAGFVKVKPRPLTQNFNPNQVGSKEMSKATQYKPFPPMGSLVSMYGTDKAI